MADLPSKHDAASNQSGFHQLTALSSLTILFVAETTCNYKFSFMPGFFIDYVEAAQQYPEGKVQTQPRLGILTRDYDGEDPVVPHARQWKRLAKYIKRLNAASKDGESYKILYVIRHGFGIHNQVMEEVGREAWRAEWSLRDGDGVRVWADAHLAPAGYRQAEDLRQSWFTGMTKDKIPVPQSLYTSPLARCLETTKVVYESYYGEWFEPIVKELLRERLTNHPCDKRSNKSWIVEHYDRAIFDPDFTEEDLLWKADRTESEEDHIARKQKLLEDIFSHDDNPFISLTTHSYAFSALLAVIGAAKFRLGEGVMVPLFIKGEKVAPE
ncbi:phosphoglycerate mutase [Seiridium cupressi]